MTFKSLATGIAVAAILALCMIRWGNAGPLDDCAAMLPGGVAPVLNPMPAHHTELCHAGYVLSHDDDAHEPRWVAWRLTGAHLLMPHLARTNDFRADPALPPGAGARPTDYAGSHYDQGHLSDAEDNSYSAQTEHESFLMSNMIPQTPAANRQIWRYIENWTRAQATKRGEVYVIAGPVLAKVGPYGLIGDMPKTIGPDHVVVPIASWKIAVSWRKGSTPVQGLTCQNGAGALTYLGCGRE